MKTAMWNGQLLDADNVAKDFEFEKKIRIEGANHKINCIDTECKSYIHYKHGEKRGPHFFHENNSECAYTQFEKQDTPQKAKVRNTLYEHFKELNYDVIREARLPNSRIFCDLMFTVNNKRLALFITSKSKGAVDIQRREEECTASNCKPLWIAIGDPNESHIEKNTYHAMRHQFNHTSNNNLLIIDDEATTVTQYKEDNSEYGYKGHKLEHGCFSGDVHHFHLKSPISELRIIDEELTIGSFSNKFNKWMNRKQTAFDKMKDDIDNKEILRKEEEKQRAKKFEEEFEKQLQMRQEKSKIIYERPLKKANIPSPRHKHTRATSKDINDYTIGTKVRHSKYGDGVIVDVEINPNKHCPKIAVSYNNAPPITQDLKILIDAGTISICE